MNQVTFDSQMHCQLVAAEATDDRVANAARVSNLGEAAETADHERDKGLINFLMKNRHGSPFEHCMFTWLIKVPIFVMRELHRHRIASYNEQSGRYTVLEGRFYIPPAGRLLTQVGKPGHYEYVPGDPYQAVVTGNIIRMNSEKAWENYSLLLTHGIAKEVARMVLPVNIYSACYVTMNPRALMNFLSLRTSDADAAFPSFPMNEIEILARMMETDFEERMPFTYEAFSKNGRVAP